jgi:hypothetical protein
MEGDGFGRRESRYNRDMFVATFIIRLLEAMFFVGLAGSAVVVVISFIEDGKDLFGHDDSEQPPVSGRQEHG